MKLTSQNFKCLLGHSTVQALVQSCSAQNPQVLRRSLSSMRMFPPQLRSAISRIVRLYVLERYSVPERNTSFGAEERSSGLEFPPSGLSSDHLHSISVDSGRRNSDQAAGLKHGRATVTRLKNKFWGLRLQKHFATHAKPSGSAVSSNQCLLRVCNWL